MEKSQSRLFGLTVLLAVFVAAMALVAGCGGKSSQQTEAEARTCQANQRTIMGAVAVYEAENESVEAIKGKPVGDALVPEFIQRVLTCPTTGISYTLNNEEPPFAACPTNEPGHNLIN
jgi:hypothetical protein